MKPVIVFLLISLIVAIVVAVLKSPGPNNTEKERLIKLFSRNPEFEWRPLPVEEFSFGPAGWRTWGIPAKTKMRFEITAQMPISAAMHETKPAYSATDIVNSFDSICKVEQILRSTIDCTAESDSEATLAIVDTREPQTTVAQGLLGILTKNKEMTNTAISANRVELKMWAWICIKNCIQR